MESKEREKNEGITYWTPITPQAQRFPEFPVVEERL